MKNKNRLVISSKWMTILLSVYFLLFLNLSFWRKAYEVVDISNASVVVFGVSLPLFIFSGLLIIISLLLWPYLGRPLITILLIASSVANYVMYQYGIYIDSDMVRNVFETNPNEALDLVNLNGILWVFFFGVIPSLLFLKTKIIYQPVLKELKLRAGLLAVALLIFTTIAIVSYKEYVVFGRNNREITRLINPTNYIYATFRYFQRQALAKKVFAEIDENPNHSPYQKEHIRVFVLVVGETARAMNFSLNGYERLTNPLLSGQDVISFQDVKSSGTATAFSLPAMFSSLPRKDFKVADAPFRENLIDLIQKAGYDVLWKENDFGCKKVCSRVPTVDMVKLNNPGYCDGSYCYDGVLIDDLDEYLKTLTKDTFIVLHAMGSHGPTYYKRYPDEFKKFQPTCDTSEIQNCSKEAIVNTYDNTIAYTDFVLSETIDILKRFPQFETGLLYLSDHGESLGESNIYLHGLPYSIAPDEQVKVPMILWMSEAMKEAETINYDCLRESSERPMSHDNLFHSLLSLMQVDSTTYDENLDLFKPCRK
ncbi:phosphoethanolamine--lipid A transferase [Deltaproteobacteria bacterium OttesenSCG-928-M10]|nr:phosphoethanolamine--lipid A transferase [Deltaproteobacteria bacterium OttesenSCG-928-M10]